MDTSVAGKFKMKEGALRVLWLHSQNQFTSEKAFYKWKMLTFQDKLVSKKLIRMVTNSRITSSKAMMILKKLSERPPISKVADLLEKLERRRVAQGMAKMKNHFRYQAISQALKNLETRLKKSRLFTSKKKPSRKA